MWKMCERKSQSPVSIILSVIVTVFLLWQLFGVSEPMSTPLLILTIVVLIGNFVFLAMAITQRGKG